MLTRGGERVFAAHTALHALERSPQPAGWAPVRVEKGLSGSCAGKGRAGAWHAERPAGACAGKGASERGADVEERNGEKGRQCREQSITGWGDKRLVSHRQMLRLAGLSRRKKGLFGLPGLGKGQ